MIIYHYDQQWRQNGVTNEGAAIYEETGELVNLTGQVNEAILRKNWIELCNILGPKDPKTIHLEPAGREGTSEWKANRNKIGEISMNEVIIMKRTTQRHVYDLYEKRTIEVIVYV